MKKILKWGLIALGVIIVLTALARGCSGDDTPTSGGQTSTELEEQANSNDKIEETEEATETPEEEPVGQIGEGDVGDHRIVIGDVTFDEDYAETPVAIVSFSWTNNSEKSASFAATLTDECFQDGVRCNPAIVSGINSASDSMKRIKPGATLEFKQVYKIDSSKPFDIEVKGRLTFKDTGLVTKTFDALAGASESTDESTTTTEEAKEKKSFGIGFDEFQQRFRTVAKEQDSGLRVGAIEVNSETGIGVAEISSNLGFMIGLNEDNEITGVIFLGQGDGSDDSGLAIVRSMTFAIQAVTDMTKEDAEQILIDAGIADDGAGKIISNGIEYSFGTSDALGATMTIQYVE